VPERLQPRKPSCRGGGKQIGVVNQHQWWRVVCDFLLSHQLLTIAQLTDTNGQATPASQSAPATDMPGAPLLEAPASVNVHLELAGRQVQLTLRDSDEGRLLARLDAILQRFPLVVKPTDTPARPDGWSSKHGVQMTQNHKEGRSWWSHKTADGWCKGR
jgi:hypothetical protein